MTMKRKDYLIEVNKLIEQEKYKDTEALLFKIIKSYEDPLLYYYLGLAQVKLNKVQLGVDNLWRSISLDIDSTYKHPRNLLAELYIKENELSLAEKFLRESIVIDKNINTYITLIEVLISLEKKEEAKKFIESIKIEFPKNLDSKKLTSLEKKISSI